MVVAVDAISVASLIYFSFSNLGSFVLVVVPIARMGTHLIHVLAVVEVLTRMEV